jgi:hypothetical protein
MLNLKEELAEVRVGPAAVFGGLATFPLLRATPVSRDYLTLWEAFRDHEVEISEVSDGGSVPELKLKNKSKKDLFGADGETLLGAKQNRVLNTSIYVKAGEEVIVPVSCVEQGRWSYRERNLRDCDLSEFVYSRAAKMGSVSASLKAGGYSRAANQGEVWRQVGAKGQEFGAYSPTGSMSDYYESKRHTLDDYVRNFEMKPDQVGLACAIDGRVVGLELFEETGVFGQFIGKLIRAYASEAIGKDRVVTAVPDRTDVRHLLRKILRVQVDEYPAVGSGTELRFSAGRLNGTALAVKERLLHMVLLTRARRRASY